MVLEQEIHDLSQWYRLNWSSKLPSVSLKILIIMWIYCHCSMKSYLWASLFFPSCSSTVMKVVISRLSQPLTMKSYVMLHGHLVVPLCMRHVTDTKWWWYKSLVKLSLLTLRWHSLCISVSPVMMSSILLTWIQACISYRQWHQLELRLQIRWRMALLLRD